MNLDITRVSMKKILLVSIAAPPKSDPESLQVGRYIKYLIKSGYEIDVITSSNPSLYMETDNHLEYLLKGINLIHEIKLVENRYINYLIRKVFPALIEFPDSKFSFHLSTSPVARPSLLYSRSYPLSSTLLALKYKKRWPDVPWVLHLSDPWAISYLGNSPATNFKKLSRKWNEKKELECFELADRIGLTSDKTIQLYKNKYPEYSNKFILTPNVFDEESLNSSHINFDDKLNIVYTGGFGEKRDPVFYLEAIEAFLVEHLTEGATFNFLFTGPMTKQNRNKFEKFKKISEIKHLGHVSYTQMIEIQRNAHVLVNIDTDIQDPAHSVFFPSKLLEYFAANRRILAITNSHSVSYDIVQDNFGDCVEFGDTKTLKELFSLYLVKFNNNRDDFFRLNKSIQKFGAEFNVAILKKKIDKLINKD